MMSFIGLPLVPLGITCSITYRVRFYGCPTIPAAFNDRYTPCPRSQINREVYGLTSILHYYVLSPPTTSMRLSGCFVSFFLPFRHSSCLRLRQPAHIVARLPRPVWTIFA